MRSNRPVLALRGPVLLLASCIGSFWSAMSQASMNFAHLRVWRQVSNAVAPKAAAGQVLRVLQYNVLADSLAEGAQHDIECVSCVDHFRTPGSAGVHYYQEPMDSCHVFRTPHKNLKWERRFPMLIAEIKLHAPDIICLQEVDHFASMQTALRSIGYEGDFYKKKGGRNIADGSAIFWRSGRLSLLARKGVHLGVSIMTALMVRLAANDGSPLVVCSTHLKAGFSAEMEDIRAKQVAELLNQIGEFAGDNPVVLGADLNAHCAAYYRCNRERCCDPEELVQPKVVPALELSGFSNAYGSYPSFTTWGGWLDRDVKATLDYIFLWGAISAHSALELPPDEAIADHPERLPNELCPSDHLCLVADVSLTAQYSTEEVIQPKGVPGNGKRDSAYLTNGKGKVGARSSNAGSKGWQAGGVSKDCWGSGWRETTWASNWHEQESYDWPCRSSQQTAGRKFHRW